MNAEIPLHITREQAVNQLAQEAPAVFAVLMRHGSMSVEYFAPKDRDTQTPHRQDELYIIAAGESKFYRNGETVHCKTGDVLFVPAGMEHRFINFSDDFAIWVIFYGPDGGEQG
jgi:mannose-6-phosphate isomerase-like protein (cupin superfamily)